MFTFFNDKLLCGVKPYLNTSIANNYRLSATRMLHSLLLLCYGPNLNDTFSFRDISALKLSKSCKEIENFLMQNKMDANFIWDDIIKIERIKKVYEELKDVVRWFTMTINYKNSFTKGKKFEHGLFKEFIYFFIYKKQNKILTTSYVEQNLELIYNFACMWYKYKKSEEHRDGTRRTTRPEDLKKIITIMDDFYIKSKLDNSIKNNNIKQSDKTLAMLTTTNKCPITNIELNDNNIQFDHIEPNSTCSETTIKVVSNIGNRRKSDMTTDTIQKTLNYVINNK